MTSIKILRGDWRPAIRALPPGEAVAAIGDVHGHDDLFGALTEALVADMRGAGRATLLQLGDLVDRGPASLAALRRARAGVDGVTSVTLLGNHEERMLKVIEARDSVEAAAWLDFGGRETLLSADVDPYADDWPDGLAQALGADLLGWIAGSPRSHRIGDLLFVHAGIDPGTPLAGQDPRVLVWTRRPWLDSSGPYPENVAVIHGHTPTVPVDLGHPHRINLDTGAFHTGLLSGLVLAGNRMRLVQASR